MQSYASFTTVSQRVKKNPAHNKRWYHRMAGAVRLSPCCVPRFLKKGNGGRGRVGKEAGGGRAKRREDRGSGAGGRTERGEERGRYG